MNARFRFRSMPAPVVTLVLLALGACGVEPSVPQVSYERLLSAEADSGNWLTYSGSYSGRRFTRLSQIGRSNVHFLQPGWSFRMDAEYSIETTPLVVDGVMYLTRPPANVLALDTRTGTKLWEFARPVPSDIKLCCGYVNRGVAILGQTLYLGTIDAHLVALDAATGRERWTVRVVDYESGFSITAAPLVVKDMVVTGVAVTQRVYRPGRQVDTRGHLTAYDARTGQQRWRFHTVPGPGEPGNETWDGESWLQGGSSTWMTGTFDSELNLLYWGIGNPMVTQFGELREGDNLYSASLVAIDVDTGQLRWYFQFTPHDVHDWDAAQVPVLADMRVDGEDRKLLMMATKNSFFYVLDRETGAFIRASQFARQNWATAIDETGRPVLVPGLEPSLEGVLVSPSATGGTNWWAPSYSPHTELFYVTARDASQVYRRPRVDWFDEADIARVEASWSPAIDTTTSAAAVRALDPRTGELAWESALPRHTSSGILTTASSLLFVGTSDGELRALDAVNGAILWRGAVGGWVNAAPMSYLVAGQQVVSIATSGGLFTFQLSPDAPVSPQRDQSEVPDSFR